MSELKLGKKPFVPDPRDLKFEKYLTTPVVKTAPRGFSHAGLVKNPWGMLKNDRLGDCEIARQLHSAMLWSATAGNQIRFTDSEAVRVYSAVTGYDPSDPYSDQGTNMRDCLNYARQYGVQDSQGKNHTIGAYAFIDPKNTNLLLRALYLCDQVAIGFEFPEAAMQLFIEGKPWTLTSTKSSPIVGGHAIEVVGRPKAESLDAVTWGTVQRLTFGFYSYFNDESWAVISADALSGGKTLEGFDLEQLNADLAAL